MRYRKNTLLNHKLFRNSFNVQQQEAKHAKNSDLICSSHCPAAVFTLVNGGKALKLSHSKKNGHSEVIIKEHQDQRRKALVDDSVVSPLLLLKYC